MAAAHIAMSGLSKYYNYIIKIIYILSIFNIFFF